MLFKRTLRRKMVGGLALVLVMLVILALGGISGLSSYRNAVHDLRFIINEAPRQEDLSAALGRLFAPLLLNVRNDDDGAELQQSEFRTQLEYARQQISEFRRRLDDLPPTKAHAARQPLTGKLLSDIEHHLGRLERLQDGLCDPVRRAGVAVEMRDEVMRALALAVGLPDYQEGLSSTLSNARDVYRSRFWLVCTSSAVVVFLFLWLVRAGYLYIFAPLRQLHQGACRVAQGDFDYRIALPSDDEMGELADSFNQMTVRFQEIAGDLDRQVRERSKQLVRSERLAGIGFLAAGVAHEINNPLSAISMAAESLSDRSPELLQGAAEADAAVARQYLTMIRTEADRCQQITSRLLHFARGQDVRRIRCDVTALVAEVLSMVRHMNRFRDRRIEFERTQPCWLEVNGPEIKQVVLNIVSNALESMDPGGALAIRLCEQTDQVVIAFEDNGCGMSSDTIDNLFEPFFTRRRDGRGTGLGMAISHRIVADHGGTIEADSDGPGCGSTFRVHLPRRAATAQAA